MNLVLEGQPAHEEELGMTKHGKLLPARRQRDRSRDEDSILLRSAESLGRVIGTLQRQLDGATQRLSGTADNVMNYLPFSADGDGDGARGSVKTSRKTTAPKARTTAGNGQATGTLRKSKRAAKSTAARKTAKRKTSRKTTGRR
jgi:hypothetical protein